MVVRTQYSILTQLVANNAKQHQHKQDRQNLKRRETWKHLPLQEQEYE